MSFALRGGWWVAAQGPLMLAAVALPPWLGQLAPPAQFVAGGAMVAFAFLLVGWSRKTLGASFTPFPKPVETGSLVIVGPFGLVRHPIYTAIIVAAAGWALQWQSIAGAACAALLAVFFDLKSRREEIWLAEKYGGYAAYRSRVKRFIPFIY